VLSIAKLSPGQEAYYESSVAQGVDDYYAGRGESPGVWHGGGAAGLGLLGVVEDGDLGRLMRGVDPATQRQLRGVASVRRVRVESSTRRRVSGWWWSGSCGRWRGSISCSGRRRA
jgi:hypothetical protein